MKLLVEILGMTNYCNLRCTYCDWKMKPIKPLAESELAAAEANMRRIGEIVEAHFPTAVFVEYSGGEPFVYPGVVDALLDTFSDRWIRISTNGTLIRPKTIAKLAGRKAYLAMSLDGHTAEANTTRFGQSLTMLDRVNGTLGACLAEGVPVMVLCTVNTTNIDTFERYANYLADRYAEPIQKGLLTMPAHCVSDYEKPNGKPTIPQALRFEEYIRTRARQNPLIAPIHEHYERLADFIRMTTCKRYFEEGQPELLPIEWLERLGEEGYERTCFLYDWQVNFHFLDDAIAKGGAFRGFGCGMRGVGDLGTYPVGDGAAVRRYLDVVSHQDGSAAPFRGDRPVGQRCPLLADCFVDWNAIDMIISGAIDLDRAGAWSVMFRDPKVIAGVRAAQAKYGAGRRAQPGPREPQRAAAAVHA